MAAGSTTRSSGRYSRRWRRRTITLDLAAADFAVPGLEAVAERLGVPPTLICGKLGTSSSSVTHTASPGKTCSAIERSLAQMQMNLDVDTCTLTARAPASPPV